MKYIYRWWRASDKPIMISVMTLMFIGIGLGFSVSSVLAQKLGVTVISIMLKQIIYCLCGLFCLIFFSCLSTNILSRYASFAFLVSFIFTVMTFYFGVEIKGSKRWLYLFGVSIQTSEFLKIFFVVLNALLLKIYLTKRTNKTLFFSLLIFFCSTGVIIIQPDVGNSILITLVFLFQIFLSGLPIIFIIIFGLVSLLGLGFSYIVFAHVASRINNFVSSNLSYQISKSLSCFRRGGMLGVGPGEGTIKSQLPDAHTDFIFSVAGEELGLLFCCLIVLIFIFVVLRGFLLASRKDNLFNRLCIAGVMFLLGAQAFINIFVSLNLAPTKGMPLPFISCGGSSIISSSICIGIALAAIKNSYLNYQYKLKYIHFQNFKTNYNLNKKDSC